MWESLQAVQRAVDRLYEGVTIDIAGDQNAQVRVERRGAAAEHGYRGQRLAGHVGVEHHAYRCRRERQECGRAIGSDGADPGVDREFLQQHHALAVAHAGQ